MSFQLTQDPMADLDRALGTDAGLWEACHDGDPPFSGGFIGYLSYDLGGYLEPKAGGRARSGPEGHDRGWPLLELAHCPGALVYDNLSRVWYAVGEPPFLPCPTFKADHRVGRGETGVFRAGGLKSNVEPDRYLAMIARTKEYIAAGDIFQANITHRFSASFTGSTRALAVRALAASGAWYGAYLELPGGRCAVSLSPELFLAADFAAGSVVTRPVKGTRPSRVAPEELLGSAKDTAELNMIVALMRNDLGRVCRYGSVRVPRPRVIETHPTVHHGVAEVIGMLRPDVGVGDLLRATFPGGSITGAPKIRAMQIIDELEPHRRGPYCGAIGYISCGCMQLNIAIRTIVLTGRRPRGVWDQLTGTLDYGVGGGIVADSEPPAEYRETLDKAAIVRHVLGQSLEEVPR